MCLNLLSGSCAFLISIPGSFAWRLRFQKDDRILSEAQRGRLESKVQELAQKLEINKPIEIMEKNDLTGGAQAQGVALFSGRVGIAIDPDVVREIPEEQLEFLMAHELSHIKANDAIRLGVVSGIIGAITTLAMSRLFPSSAAHFSPAVMISLMISSPAAAVGSVVSMIFFSFYSRCREECADKLGVSICSDAAQKAAPELFEKGRALQLEYRNNEGCSSLVKLWRRFLITEDGEFRFDLFHPSLKNRIKYLRPTNLAPSLVQ